MPPLDPVFVTLNRGQLPTLRGPHPDQGLRLRRAEEIETLSYRTVVALNQESRLAPGGAWPASPVAANAPSAWQANAPGVPTAARPSGPPAPTAAAEPTNPKTGGCSAMPASSTTHSGQGWGEGSSLILISALHSGPFPQDRIGDLVSPTGSQASRQQPPASPTGLPDPSFRRYGSAAAVHAGRRTQARQPPIPA
jgi:hypothetical protein